MLNQEPHGVDQWNVGEDWAKASTISASLSRWYFIETMDRIPRNMFLLQLDWN
jgi:hypothetical protein